MNDSERNETYSHEETVARREAALKRMLATPHKPHKDQVRKVKGK
jgi:hypothetical protein